MYVQSNQNCAKDPIFKVVNIQLFQINPQPIQKIQIWPKD